MSESVMLLPDVTRALYRDFGQRKSMGTGAPSATMPHFFLMRRFCGDNDLLVILNTKRCRYQCHFCQLPAKSSREWINSVDIATQFMNVMIELKHALSMLDRLTLSNEGSVLDPSTLGSDALDAIVDAVAELRHVRRLVLETRLEFVSAERLLSLNRKAPNVQLDILTGFETITPSIRDTILGKRESIDVFLKGLDEVQRARADLTAYVLFKPSPDMDDSEAYQEADASIHFLRRECQSRDIPLTVRLNPMYVASGSNWERRALRGNGYRPPRLTDVVDLADTWRSRGLKVYLGLSTEGLADDVNTYRSREDFGPDIMRRAKALNDGHASTRNA